MARRALRSAAWWIAAGAGAAAGGYLAFAGVTWSNYGHPRRPTSDEEDPLLDHFMPRYDVVERHHVRVRAPASVTLAAATEMDMAGSPVARAIFAAREFVMGASDEGRRRPHGLVAEVAALGWRMLAEHPGREIVMGAVTQPWQPNVVFRGLSPDEFVAFNDPDYVKIAFTLRADPEDEHTSIFRTETRAVATDAHARIKFRRYWSFVSPGVWLIRWLSLGPLRREAESRTS